MTPTIRVRRGARLLDDRNAYWWRHVDIGCLEAEDNRRCVLGQVYGDFHLGLSALKLTGWKAARHGFTNTVWPEISEMVINRFTIEHNRIPLDNAFLDLTLAWQKEVGLRYSPDWHRIL